MSLNVDEFALVTIAMAVGFVGLFFAAALLPHEARVGITDDEHSSV